MTTALINGLGGAAGFGESLLDRGDDNSSALLPLGSVFSSGIGFFGTVFTGLFVNNNGNLTFNAADSGNQNPNLSDLTNNPVIAPFLADVDTTTPPAGGTTAGGTSTGSNRVYWDFDTTARVFTATWDDVGRFSLDNSVRNAFQVRLIQANILDDRASATDFDIEFRYETIDWANASDGAGVPSLGFSKGTGPSGLVLIFAPPLTMESQTNVGDPGRFLFNIRNGVAALPSDGDDRLTGSNQVEQIDGQGGNDSLLGFGGDDTLRGGAGGDFLFGGAQNDTLEGGTENDTLDGGADSDTAVFSEAPGGIRIREIGGGSLSVETAGLGTDTLTNVEIITTTDGSVVMQPDLTGLFRQNIAGENSLLLGTRYVGPVAVLERQLFGTAASEVYGGTGGNDFMNLFAGDDAANAGAGNDVVDGGLGSNFLSGGAGKDTFFSDGRGGGVTWTTITDWEAGEQLSVFGWRPGTSRVSWAASDGVGDFKGVTMRGDLNGDGTDDTIVTWSGKTQDSLPTPNEFDGLLWFIG